MTALLQVRGVSRRFGGLTALHPVTFAVDAGTCHAIIGPNGAGKSTLLNVIAGTVAPSSGVIIAAGRDITRMPAAARARHGIGRTWQHPAVCRRLTVAANLTLAVNLADQGPRARRHSPQLAALIDDAGLADVAATVAGRLPYGLQRRLELAMALAARPRLLLLDEPSAGLDPDEVTQLADRITALAGDVTVLLVDHRLDLVWALADTVTVLHHGQRLTTGSPDQIRADPQVRSAYLAHDRLPPTASRDRPTVGPPILQVQQLRAGYHGAPVLDSVSLDVGEGEAVALLGRNGAGKTTLLNTIAGITPSQGGQIILAGQPNTRRRSHQLARAGLAIVPQGRRLFGALTVAEHLNTATRRANAGTAGRWTVERIRTLFPALTARTHHPASRLSGGEQQMLALARALLTNPRLLILDEPSEGLAPTAIAALSDVLTDLITNGLAVLIAEQNLPVAAAVADRVLVLHDGRIATACSTSDLATPGQYQQVHNLLGITPGPPWQHHSNG